MTRRRLSMIIRQREWNGENKKPALNCISSYQKQKIIIKKTILLTRVMEATDDERRRKIKGSADRRLRLKILLNNTISTGTIAQHGRNNDRY